MTPGAQIIQFLFVVAVPLVIVAGGAVTLFALGALFDALEHPEQVKQRIEEAFRRPPRPPRKTRPTHYYKVYWV